MQVIRGRENYYKYQDVKHQLETELQTEQTARVIAKKLNIAVSTFHKYKNLLQLEKGEQFMTSDERAFKDRLCLSATYAAIAHATSVNPEAQPHDISIARPEADLKPNTEPQPAMTLTTAEKLQEPVLAVKRKKR